MKKTFLLLLAAVSLNTFAQSEIDLSAKIPTSNKVKIGKLLQVA